MKTYMLILALVLIMGCTGEQMTPAVDNSLDTHDKDVLTEDEMIKELMDDRLDEALDDLDKLQLT
jgi:uncharacterized protein YcfL